MTKIRAQNAAEARRRARALPQGHRQVEPRQTDSQRRGSNLQIGRRDLGPGAGVHFAARVKDDLAGDGARAPGK